MLRITLHDSANGTRLQLEGKLAGAWVQELENCWTTAASALKGREMVVDLKGVTHIASEGRELLCRMHGAGVRLVAAGIMNQAVVDAIEGRTAVLVLLCAALCLAPGAARAQDAGPVRLTLRDAALLALRQNPQVQIANLNLAQSREDVAISRSGLLPQAGLRVSESVNRTNIQAQLGMSFPGFAKHIGPFEVFQAGAGFSAPVFDLTLWRRWQASRKVVDAVSAQEQGVREQTLMLVTSQYLGALRASADVHAAQSRVELAQALYNQAADLQKHGVGTGIDTLRANVQLQNERQRLIGAQTQFRTGLFGLARLLNIDPGREVALADEMSFFETPPIAVDQSLDAAYRNRPELRALEAQAAAVALQREATGAARLPSVRFDGGWSQLGLSPATVIPSYQYQFSLNVPVYTGGRISAEQARVDLEARKVEQRRVDVRNAVALEVKTAAAQLEAARTEVDVANQGVALAREEVVQARDRFQAGVANNIEVISAQDALARAADNQIVALYRYNQARADLAHATGQMQSVYTK
jgi:outer membrane protein